jgi:cephalosporin-C deacetylase
VAWFDLPQDQLRLHRSQVQAPDDLAEFWSGTLAEARAHYPLLSSVAARTGLDAMQVYDVTFAGFDGQGVSAWLTYPRATAGPLPCVVEYVGYGGGRGHPWEWLLWPSAGYAHLVMDTRGQGSQGRSGVTPDRWPVTGPHADGYLTMGLEDPDGYYYRRVYTDAVRAVDTARALPQVDSGRIAVAGGSQGGGIALAVAGLVDGLAAALIDMPFLCDMRRASGLVDTEPYAQIGRYLRTNPDRAEQAFATLAYFDGTVLGRTATAPALMSVGLMDDVCPPSTVFAAANAYGHQANVIEYPYSRHDVPPPAHRAAQLEFLREHLRR